ncbi:MAG TPA: sigma-54 dependent transcriptional regulator [Polyangiaceae bacterium]|jgi:two-component system response regulator HydG|nr:sigma-54 dependent transcriptional regulator [Polyangiaceae bacterium]
MKILIIDDQKSARRVLRQLLATLSYAEISEADSLASAKAAIESAAPDLMLVDVRLTDALNDRGGLDLLSWMRSTGRTIPAVMVTSSTEIVEIREAMRRGAQDYVFKDELSAEMLLPIVEGIHERLHLKGEVLRLRQRVDRTWGTAALVGSSPAMARVRRLIERVADAEAPVLIRGETGTGKELVARALHQLSARHEHPFLAVNCSALPGTLIESLIFGHERGAFTGAERRVRGHLELAGQGTLLLDEIAEMPPELQVKLLRVLEDRKFRPLGSETELPLKARVLAATHIALEERLHDGGFREDLFFRLNVVAIEMPALAERREDIAELLQAFLADVPRNLSLTDRAVTWLTQRQWPGNVRELRNAVERLALLSEVDRIDAPVLDELVGAHALGTSAREVDTLAKSILALPVRLGSKLDVIERAVLHHAIETCGGNKSAAARLIGVDRKALERKWDRLSDHSDLELPPESREPASR